MTEEALDPQVQIKGLHYLPKRSTTLFEKPQVSVQKVHYIYFQKGLQFCYVTDPGFC